MNRNEGKEKDFFSWVDDFNEFTFFFNLTMYCRVAFPINLCFFLIEASGVFVFIFQSTFENDFQFICMEWYFLNVFFMILTD